MNCHWKVKKMEKVGCREALQSLKKLEDSNVQCTTQPKHLHEMYRLTNLNYLHKDINLNTITIS
ncbi:hypothetical protein MTR_2g069345 [Medicago truncatula]|uniref:Uncharacterized protein n=1 Tax=Medicago truncatula TaxID=3880 RepID=A0A072VAE3_MEDTR|nr:hypothetical protein MTR_2g069345 [Medicago truncatula]